MRKLLPNYNQEIFLNQETNYVSTFPDQEAVTHLGNKIRKNMIDANLLHREMVCFQSE